ncbi:hypothetical protein [Mycolicibacterium mageritense]|uniref:Serine/threonine protein kinase n=1 Tax=Mycolicibacterium mageritense TaxID=53462 RepID=A0AAI8U000_MYCME|nr:hypothetical protein [Mycolicibacterium mageritense]BDY32055.1 hypothetical protein hbim_06017 [Mycolicibacterium mageritense]
MGLGLLAAGAVGAMVATVVAFSSSLAAKLSARHSAEAVGARNLTTAPTPAVRPQHRAQPASAPVAVSPYAVDEAGFVGSPARCTDTQTIRAIGRTRLSLVVICLDRSGRFEYHGVRLSDKAALTAGAQTVQGRQFLARNANVSYAVSPRELLVTAGSTIIKQEPMVEFREMLSTPVVVAPR